MASITKFLMEDMTLLYMVVPLMLCMAQMLFPGIQIHMHSMLVMQLMLNGCRSWGRCKMVTQCLESWAIHQQLHITQLWPQQQLLQLLPLPPQRTNGGKAYSLVAGCSQRSLKAYLQVLVASPG